MNQLALKSRHASLVPFQMSDITHLFRLGTELVDLAENMLESNSSYSKVFLEGLNTSLKEEQKGKLKKIESLYANDSSILSSKRYL